MSILDAKDLASRYKQAYEQDKEKSEARRLITELGGESTYNILKAYSGAGLDPEEVKIRTRLDKKYDRPARTEIRGGLRLKDMTGFESMEGRKTVSDFLKEYGYSPSIGKGIAAAELAVGAPALVRAGIKYAPKIARGIKEKVAPFIVPGAAIPAAIGAFSPSEAEASGFLTGGKKTLDILKKIKQAKPGRQKGNLIQSPEFLNLVKKTFNEMTVNGVPPTRKAVFEKLGVFSDGKNISGINNLLKKPGFKDIPFRTKEETALELLKSYSGTSEVVSARMATSTKRAQDRANKTKDISLIVQEKGKDQIVLPTNVPDAKEKFLLELEEVYKPRKKGQIRQKTLEDLANEKNLNYSRLSTAIRNFLKKEGLEKDPRYNLNPINKFKTTQTRMYAKDKEKAVQDWLKNPDVPQFEKDLFKEGKEIVSQYNKIFPNDKRQIDHILGYVNSKSLADAHYLGNLQITSAKFNSIIKKTYSKTLKQVLDNCIEKLKMQKINQRDNV